MTIKVVDDLRTNYPVHPGAILSEELEARGMTCRELARQLGRSARTVGDIVRARRAITVDTALELERVLGIPARNWLDLQTLHDLTAARLFRAKQSA